MLKGVSGTRPSELYENLHGKYIQVQGGNAFFIGKLREVDLQNGVLVLDEVPILDPTQKNITTNNTRIIPFGSDVLSELTRDSYNCLVAELSVELQFIGKWVAIDPKYLGKLENVHTLKYELNPAVSELQPRQWSYAHGSVFVPREFSRSVIVPVSEDYVRQLVADSVLRADDERLREKLASLELRRQSALYDRKAQLEAMELEARFSGVRQALVNHQGRQKEAPDPSSLISTLREFIIKKLV